MNRFACAILFVLGVTVVLNSTASGAIVLQPNEAASKDSFGYEFLPTFNFDTGMFALFLPVSQTTTPKDGHDIKSILQFDLSSVTLTAAQVTSATLELNAVDTTTTGFGVNGTASQPILVNLFAVGSTWTESTVTYGTLPTTAGQFATASVDTFNQAFTFDVTNLVKQWLDGTLTNHGFFLEAGAPQYHADVDKFGVATFSSSGGAVAPKLTIVPEPSSMVLGLSAVGTVALMYRRRTMRRHRLA